MQLHVIYIYSYMYILGRACKTANCLSVGQFSGYHSQFTPVQLVRQPSTSRSTTPAAVSRVRSPGGEGKWAISLDQKWEIQGTNWQKNGINI